MENSLHPDDAAVSMNSVGAQLIKAHKVSSVRTLEVENYQQLTWSTNTAGEAGTISPQNKLSSLTTGAKSKVTTRMQLYCRTSLPGRTGLTIVIGGLHTHTLTRSRPLGRINICWDCTLFQQCKIYSRRGGFTLCLRSNSSVQPNY